MYKCEVRNTWWTRIYLYSNKTMTNDHTGHTLYISVKMHGSFFSMLLRAMKHCTLSIPKMT